MHNFNTSWVLCHISVVFSSNHKKVIPWWKLHLHAKFHPIPSSSLPSRLDKPSTFFTRNINHNSINLNHIPTKISTEMPFNKPFMCAKFQFNRNMRSQVMAENGKCANKWKRKWSILKFCLLISRDWLAQFASDLVCRFAYFGSISVANLVEFR